MGLRQAFHRDAAITAAAPGRVNLIGEHIDYCDGFVLPFAIDRHVVVAAAANDSRTIRIGSTHGGAVTIALEYPVIRGQPKWANYVRGVIRGFQDRGIAIPGFDAWIVSTLPVGAGLSSSAALECAVATLLEVLVGRTLVPRDKAVLCQKAEHDFAGVPCGIMDQYASTFGMTDRLVLIDCRSGEPTLLPAVTALAVGNVGERRNATTGGHADGRHAAEGCCNTHEKPRSHETSRIAWAKLMARVGEEFPLECPACGGDIRLISFITEPGPIHATAACRSRPTSNRRFASGRRPGWLRPREAAPPPISPARGPPTDWGELVQVHDDRDVFQSAPDELPAIDIHSL